ncbi:hypothetical protein B296_00027423, partial [Ensete ventricosum]
KTPYRVVPSKSAVGSRFRPSAVDWGRNKKKEKKKREKKRRNIPSPVPHAVRRPRVARGRFLLLNVSPRRRGSRRCR